jgi:phosphoribosylanthranilate isomerase
MWVKICGVTSEDAVAAALESHADALGFIFAPSVRRLTVQQAAKLAKAARGRASLVAVTLHPEQTLVDEILEVFRPDVLQTDLADLDRLQLPNGLARLPVLRAGSGAALPSSRRFLFEGARSGSGELGDWSAAARLASLSELILAGGLTPDNVAAAIRGVAPFGVDVSSGVELAPGRKSTAKISQFIAAARAAFQQEPTHGNRPVG